MLSEYILDIGKLLDGKETWVRISRIVKSVGLSDKALPWLDDNLVKSFMLYSLLEACLYDAKRYDTAVYIVDSQYLPLALNENATSQRDKYASIIKNIYYNYEVIIHPVNSTSHWFLIVYYAGTFVLYDSSKTTESEEYVTALNKMIFGQSGLKQQIFHGSSIQQEKYWECGYFTLQVFRRIVDRIRAGNLDIFPVDEEVQLLVSVNSCREFARIMLEVYNKCKLLL